MARSTTIIDMRNNKNIDAVRYLRENQKEWWMIDDDGYNSLEIEFRKFAESCGHCEYEFLWFDDSGVRFFLQPSTNILTLAETDYTLVEYLRDWDYGDVDFSEFIAFFGLSSDKDLDIADDKFNGKCNIWVKYSTNVGALNAPIDGYLKDDSLQKNIVFASYKTAREWLLAEEREIYYTGSDESGRPEYIIIEAE